MYVARRSGSESWQENYETLEDRKRYECYVSKKNQGTNFVFSKLIFFLSFLALCFFSVSHFWLSLGQQSDRAHKSIRRQISIKLYHHDETG